MKRSLNQNFGEAIFCFAYLTIYCKSAASEFFFPLPLCLPPSTPAFNPSTYCLFFAPNRYLLKFCYIVGDVLSVGLPQWLSGKESTCQTGDAGSIPGSKRLLWRRKQLPLQYSCLGNTMDRGAWWATVHRVAKQLNMFSSVQSLSRVRLFVIP